MRIAFVQMNIRFGERNANLARAAELIAANQADLFTLPELCTTGYLFASREEAEEMAEAVPGGPACEELLTLARRKNCSFVAGMAEKAGGKIFNSAVLLGPCGHLSTYRKFQKLS